MATLAERKIEEIYKGIQIKSDEDGLSFRIGNHWYNQSNVGTKKEKMLIEAHRIIDEEVTCV